MERDFLGVIGRAAGKGGGGAEVVVVLDAEESPAKPDNPPPPAQWQFPAKASGAAPAFMSFRAARGEEGSEEFSISGFRPAGDALDGAKKQTSSLPVISQPQQQQQRQFGLSSSQVTAQQYPPAPAPAAAHGQRLQGMDYGAAALHHLHGGSRLVQPLSVRHPAPPFNQANLMVRSHSFHNGTGVPSRNQQPPFTMSNGFGGSTVGVYGARNPRNQTSTQLTIFYNGSVNVFDNVPVEKAKEIMMLASKASIPSPPSASHKPDSPVSAPAKVNVPEAFPARQIVTQKPEPCVPRLSSTSNSIPTVPQVVTLSRSTSHCTTEACSSKPAVQLPVTTPISQTTSSQPLATHISQATSSQPLPTHVSQASQPLATHISQATSSQPLATPIGQATSSPLLATPISQATSSQLLATTSAVAVTPRAIPQARKASLARFLEKRKERVTSVEPYPTLKSPLESSDTAGSASAPTKSSFTDIAPASKNGTEAMRLGQPRNISFSSEVCPITKLLI